MAAIRLNKVCKEYGAQRVLQDVTLELHEGQIVGLVGVNGAGKTTLFRIISGEISADLGNATTARGLQVGHLKQEPDLSNDATLLEEAASAFADVFRLEQKLHEWADKIAEAHDDPNLSEWMDAYERVNGQFLAAGGHEVHVRVNECLGGLGFSPSDHQMPIGLLSGGQKCRAALAKLLLRDREFLLLDEPTNHLDIDAVRWLERFLLGHRGGAVIISHDRYLLDRLCTRILEVDRRQVFSYTGNYSTFAQTKEIRRLTEERKLEKDTAFIEKERDFIAKHLAGQRSKEAQGRRTRLQRRLAGGEFTTSTHRDKTAAKLEFNAVESREGVVIRCDNLTMGYEGRPLFQDLSMQVQSNERIGITGPNGTGKSTLLKILMGQAAPLSGEVWMDPKRSVGWFAQDAAALDPTRTVLEEVLACRPDLTEQIARSTLGRFRFPGEVVFKSIGLLSGGEQSRLRLAKLILQGPEILILDEPTNHLDIPSREVLEEALSEFCGTVLAVSHDRYFLDRIAQRLLVIRPTGHRMYAGDYSFYLRQVEVEVAEATAKSNRNARGARSSPKAAASKRKHESPYDRMSMEEIEIQIMDREMKLAALHSRFGDADVYKNVEALEELQEQSAELEQELAELNAAWETRS